MQENLEQKMDEMSTVEQLNTCFVVGYLTDDVLLTYDEVKKTSVAKFYLKNHCKIGKNTYSNDFYVVIYGPKAERCAAELRKGKCCSVVGKMSTWSRIDKMGKTQPGVTIIAYEALSVASEYGG